MSMQSANGSSPHLGGTAFGQRENLTRRLKGLIHAYPEGIGIFQELLQNADDAGAREVRLTLDWRTHAPVNLPDARMRQLLGPALLFYNDQTFSDKDFEHIQEIGHSAKQDTLWKTGKFGVGFNAVYHVTDWPCFLSRERLVVFDPHRSVVPKEAEAPGWCWLLNSPGWWDQYADWMRCYAGEELPPGLESFPGTLFRLPFRTAEYAARSEIRDQPFTEENVRELVRQVTEHGAELLLFLKSVESIRVCEISAAGVSKELLSVQTLNSDEVRAARGRLLEPIQCGQDAFMERCIAAPDSLPAASFRHATETRSAERHSRSVWRITSVMRVDSTGELIRTMREMADRKEKAVPWAGAAACVGHVEWVPDAPPPTGLPSGDTARVVTGRAYCSLPLPEETGLSVHVNGFFDLDGSRRNLTCDPGMTGRDAVRTRWNLQVVRHVLSYACAQLIEDLVGDVGEQNVARMYSLWPVYGSHTRALAELRNTVIPLIAGREVLRVNQPQRWAAPNRVWLLPAGEEALREPLTADGMLLADPPLSPPLVQVFAESGRPLSTMKPSNLRSRLLMEQALGTPKGVPLEQAPRGSLRRRDWVVRLLRYCLKDDKCDLRGLPLALLADGTLQTFGFARSGIFIGDRAAMALFPDHQHWFLEPQLLQDVPQLRVPRAGIGAMTPAEVTRRLPVILGEGAGPRPWEPNGTALPNATWLGKVYGYYSNQAAPLPRDLDDLPLVPAGDDHLYAAASPKAPFHRGGIEPETLKALRKFGLRFVKAEQECLEAMATFLKKHPDRLLRGVTGAVLIDRLAALPPQEFPSYGEHDGAYHDLLTYLNRWAEDGGKSQGGQLAKLRALRVFPTAGGELVTLTEGDVFLPDTDPPEIAGGLKLLDQRFHSRWGSLAEALRIPTLDRATLLQRVLLPRYEGLGPSQQRRALEWIRDHFEAAQTDLERQGKDARALRLEVAGAELVRCTDSRLRAIRELYRPDSQVVQAVLGGHAPVPDMQFYRDGAERWLSFFTALGMKSTPQPQDLLTHVDRLIENAQSDGIEAAEAGCMAVFNYLVECWEQLREAKVDDPRPTLLTNALRRREWLPPIRGEALKDYSGARQPEARLHAPEELTVYTRGRLVASRRTLFRIPPQARGDLQRALGLQMQPTPEDVFAHLETLIGLWAKRERQEVAIEPFERSLADIYQYLYDTFSASQSNQQEAIRKRFRTQACLWDRRRFWRPDHAFQEPVPYYGDRRVCLRPEKPQQREAYRLLGQESSPRAADHVAFLKELAEEFAEQALPAPWPECVAEVLQRLSSIVAASDGRGRLAIPLLTDDRRLLDAARILIPDASWRTNYVERSSVALLDERVPRSLALTAGCHSLLDDVEERPRGQVCPNSDERARAWCQRWQETLRSREFHLGLERLIRHRHHTALTVELPEFRKVRVLPAQRIEMDLHLKGTGTRINVQPVDGGYYLDPQGFLYLAADDQRTMGHYLAEAVNSQLLHLALPDLSPLVAILDEAPAQIEARLTKLRIREFRSETVSSGFRAASDTGPLSPDLPFDQSEKGDEHSAVGDLPPSAPVETATAPPRLEPSISTQSNGTPTQAPAHTPRVESATEHRARDKEGAPLLPGLQDRAGEQVSAEPATASEGKGPQPWTGSPLPPRTRGAGSGAGRSDDGPATPSSPPAPAEAATNGTKTPASNEPQRDPLEGQDPPALPETHVGYDREPFQRTPSVPFNTRALLRRFPEADIQTRVERAGPSGGFERRSPGYTGPLAPSKDGRAYILARTLEDGMLWLDSPKPAALFPHREAERDTQGVPFFPTELLYQPDNAPKLRLRVDYDREVLHFSDEGDRQHMVDWVVNHGLHPGCQVTLTLLENGGYRISYVLQETRIRRVPIIGLDPETRVPIVTYVEEGLVLPCPVNERLLLGQQRFVDEESRIALLEMASRSPDLLETLMLLLESRTEPITISDLYRLTFQVRPVSFSYYQGVLLDNSGEGRLFAVDGDNVRYAPSEQPTIILPKMGGARPRLAASEERLRQELERVLVDRVPESAGDLLEPILQVTRPYLARS